MKKNILFILLFYIFICGNIFGQSTKYDWLHQNSWSLGFGFEYPRYVSASLINSDEGNYGAFLSVQRNFSEHVSGRFKANFIRITSKLSFNSVTPDVINDIYLGSFDLFYI